MLLLTTWWWTSKLVKHNCLKQFNQEYFLVLYKGNLLIKVGVLLAKNVLAPLVTMRSAFSIDGAI